MLAFVFALALLLSLLFPDAGHAIDVAPRIGDREIIERLAHLEEGQNALREGLALLRKEHELLRTEVRTEIQQMRADMKAESQQLRTDINAQFSTLTQLILGQLGAFAAIVFFTIGFALWDRKTMTRPLEDKLKLVEEEIAHNRPRLHAFLEALRATSTRDPQVAEVLKKFDLL